MPSLRRSAKKTTQKNAKKASSKTQKISAVSAKDVELQAQRALKKWLKVCSTKPLLKKRIPGFHARDFHVDLSVISAPKMKELNTDFRGSEYPTDVLSFPADEFFQMKGLLGDVVICSPVLVRQAKEVGHSWKIELDVLLVHGILHLLRFDHEKSKKEALTVKWFAAKANFT